MATRARRYCRCAFCLLIGCAHSPERTSISPAAELCYRLTALPTEPPLLIPGNIRLTGTPTTSHFSNLEGYEAQPLPPDTLPSQASLLWRSTADSLTLVYDHYFVHVDARLTQQGDSLFGSAIYSSDVRGGAAPPMWIVSGHRTEC